MEGEEERERARIEGERGRGMRRYRDGGKKERGGGERGLASFPRSV